MLSLTRIRAWSTSLLQAISVPMMAIISANKVLTATIGRARLKKIYLYKIIGIEITRA